MYLLEYRFRAADPNEIMLAGGMRMDGDCITEWGSTGQPYLLLHWNNDGDKTVWERIGVTNTLTMQEEYSMPEMLEQYGNIYTAAAMELYAKHVGDNKNAEQSDIVLTGFSVRADGNPSEVGLKWAEAFASQYTELPDGHPFKSRDCKVFSCELTAESLMSSPKTLVFNMKFACNAVDPDAFEQQYGGWAVPLSGQKQYNGWMEFGWFVELKNTGSGEWTCTDAGTGGFGGWGYLNYEDVNDLEFFMGSMFSGELDTPENLLRAMPFFDWRNFNGKDWSAMYEFFDKYCLTEGQIYGPEATRMWKDVYPEDQAYRNMYVMLTALNSDGAYTDGLAGILKKQQNYDPELFEKCLQNLTGAQRDTVEGLVAY